MNKLKKLRPVEFFFHIWTPRIVLLPVLAFLATYLCIRNEIFYEMPVIASFFFVGIFFCFGVVMNSADDRRFKVFDEVAQIKANLMVFWQLAQQIKLKKGDQERVEKIIEEIFPAISHFLGTEINEKSKKAFLDIDQKLKKLSETTEVFRANEFSAPEISRLHQFLSQIYFSFEKLLMIKEHRTPRILRLFLQFALTISVFLLAPEFARFGDFGLILAFTVAFFLACLIEIQNKIEYPFAAESLDSIKFEFVGRFEERIKKL